MIKVTNVRYLNHYKIHVTFNDKKSKIIDLKKYVDEGGYYFNDLKDINLFKKVKVDDFNYSIIWPNGTDFCPDVLYEIGQESDLC